MAGRCGCCTSAMPTLRGGRCRSAVGRKLQAFKALGSQQVSTRDPSGNRTTRTVDLGALDFEVHRVALTPDQVRQYALPSTPLKATERRADRWRELMGVQQTEIDALASLRPDLLRQIAADALNRFYDHTLARRVSVARARWLARAQADLDAQLGDVGSDRIRAEAEDKLDSIRAQLDEINDSLRIDAGDFQLAPLEIPTAVINGVGGKGPLLNSRWSFTTQTKALIASKAYTSDAAGGVR